MKTVSEIISDCGGPLAIEAHSEGRVSHWAIRKWPANGIPDKHWPLIIAMKGFTAEQLLAANEVIRSTAGNGEVAA